ncbi:MAG: hypothetical protein ACXVY8_03955 [Gaiellaceae bacterium]
MSSSDDLALSRAHWNEANAASTDGSAEDVPPPDGSRDLVGSEHGASIRCMPDTSISEAWMARKR